MCSSDLLGLILLAGHAALAQAPPLTPDSPAPVVHAKDVAKVPMAAYVENGRALIAADPSKAPKDAVVIQVEILPLGGRASYHRVTIPKGKTFTAPKDVDALAFVVKGKLHLGLGAVEAEWSLGGPGECQRQRVPIAAKRPKGKAALVSCLSNIDYNRFALDLQDGGLQWRGQSSDLRRSQR